jgi:hypothetical protein
MQRRDSSLLSSLLSLNALKDRAANPGGSRDVTAEIVDRFEQVGGDREVDVLHRHAREHTDMYMNVLDESVRPCIIMYMTTAQQNTLQQLRDDYEYIEREAFGLAGHTIRVDCYLHADDLTASEAHVALVNQAGEIEWAS